MIEIRKARTEDREELMAMANRVFFTPEEGHCFETKIPKLYDPQVDTTGSHYIVQENGHIVAAVGAFDSQMKVGDHLLSARGIGTVSVAPEARSRGYMKKLMALAVEDMERDGIDLGYLSGRRQRYEYFSFTPSGLAARFVYTIHNARHLAGQFPTGGYLFRMVTEERTALLDQMAALHDRRQVHVCRSRELFYKILCSWYFRPLAILRDGQFVGYMTLDAEQRISEIELVDMEELIPVLNCYLEVSGQQEVTLEPLPLYDTRKIELLSRYAEVVELVNNDNLSVFRYDRVLQAFMELKGRLQTLADGELTVAIEGRQTVSISVKDQQVSVAVTNQQPDLTLSHLEAVQLFFGVSSAMGSLGFQLPVFARSWFPLPLFYPRPDNV